MEIYLGTKEDKRDIKSYLTKQRNVKPVHLLRTKNHTTLYHLLRSKEGEIINPVLFNTLILHSEKFLKVINQNFTLIEPKNYFICYDFISDDIGGFHGKIAGGYFYIHNCGLSVLLNKKYINNENILTLELCKNYIHDSIHSSTFRSIRKMPSQAFSEYYVYREQYGINFRKPDGVSFSSTEATKKVPLSINLNLLMDGIADMYAEKCLKLKPTDYNIIGSTALETAIINQLLGLSYDKSIYRLPSRFNNTVITPTKIFIDYWDKGEILSDLILKAMLSGELAELKDYFSRHLSNKDAWEIIFKRPNF